MIQPLRRIHWRIVLGLSVLLPILFFAGLRARHPKLTGKAAKETSSAGAQNAPENSARQAARQEVDR